jgi:hypothetical protein
MKRYRRLVALVGALLLLTGIIRGQDQWPKSLTVMNGSLVRIYEFQPESFQGSILKARAAFSLSGKDGKDPVFGTFWMVAHVETDRDNRLVHIDSVKVPNIKLAPHADLASESFNYLRAKIEMDYLKSELETGIPTLNIDLSLDVLLTSLDMNTEAKNLSKGLNTNPPELIYRSQPSLLVLIDGEPMTQYKKDWDVDVVVNTPFTMIKGKDGHFYLYGAHHWYEAPSATGPYSYMPSVPSNLEKIQHTVDAADDADPGYVDSAASADTAVTRIIVSTKPAELIQSDGAPVFAPIPGTDLEYVVNSHNDIFRVTTSGQYYVLLSGRWFRAGNLDGSWQYVAADALPASFAKIPEGSPKDKVLASVAGTPAAREAVLDAQIPQTARVDRKNTHVDVSYDGAPQFEMIPGTGLQYAVNSPVPVINDQGRYYAVDNGIWFDAAGPAGPWEVCTERPEEVDLIPPTCPVYNIKYVYIYDVTPDWVYVGYTPGYLNTFVFGPTVVYGTGFYYQPWRGHLFVARPWTWGFNMWYDPWVGWSFGFDCGPSWFNAASVWPGGFWFGGWWGPLAYRPPYMAWNPALRGFYGRDRYLPRERQFGYGNNIYRYRAGILNREHAERITSDRDGNVYRRNEQGNWDQRSNETWKPVTGTAQRQDLERQEQLRDRGAVRSQNFQWLHGGIFGGSRLNGSGLRELAIRRR